MTTCEFAIEAASSSHKRFSGGTVGKTPAKIIALIIAAARDVVDLNSAAGMEFVHWV